MCVWNEYLMVFIKSNTSKKKCVKHSLLWIRDNECYEKYNRNKFNLRCYREANIAYDYLKEKWYERSEKISARDKEEKNQAPKQCILTWNRRWSDRRNMTRHHGTASFISHSGARSRRFSHVPFEKVFPRTADSPFGGLCKNARTVAAAPRS